jgi:ComF family protein
MSEFDLCINCLSKCPVAERESAKWIFPLYDYRDPNIKKALWLLKYKGKKRLANTFALALYDRILEELSDLSVMENFNDAILIPIPLSDKRHRERGYNQAELICKELIKIENLRYVENEKLNSKKNFSLENNILIKPKETIHQAHIENRAERLKNIIGSFAIKSDGQGREENLNKIKNRNIIIIDDITTTGATLSEAKKVLKQAGAKKIVAFTLAH